MIDKAGAWFGIALAAVIGIVAPEVIKHLRRRRAERELAELEAAVERDDGANRR